MWHLGKCSIKKKKEKKNKNSNLHFLTIFCACYSNYAAYFVERDKTFRREAEHTSNPIISKKGIKQITFHCLINLKRKNMQPR